MNTDEPQQNHGLQASVPLAELAAHFTATYRKERGRILNLVRRLGIPPADVEDAVQDVFLALHSRFHQLDRDAGLHLWLAATALRVCSNRRRSVLRRSASLRLDGDFHVEEIVDSRQLLPDERSSDNERRRLLARAIARLDSNRQRVFVLAELEEHTAEEIAQLTRVSRNTVSSRLRVARQRVAHALRAVELRHSLTPCAGALLPSVSAPSPRSKKFLIDRTLRPARGLTGPDDSDATTPHAGGTSGRGDWGGSAQRSH